ncbi:MAG: hypothetical protein DI626_03480 [Micavibrio aeruginosavorus]|uniref:Uncharacterized protein n=1 Tax=Micavibrio aeruginosavorus TaxID=349221 RepID=A0A2W5A2V7_9BACT|nr:MAG: hypothetical protein DI626_03480 [Micavibrio aeruginosavorus]
MKNVMSKKQNGIQNDTYSATAKVVDGNLIISLPDAVNPVVWRMELGSVKASALEVRKGAAEGQSLLVLKTPKGETHEIAPYDSREKALAALMEVSNALQSAEGRMAPSSSPSQFTPVNNNQPARAQHQDKANPVKWLIALGAVLAVIVLFAFLGTLGAPEMSSGVSDSATVTGPAGNNSSGESGVPQSADEMLKGF